MSSSTATAETRDDDDIHVQLDRGSGGFWIGVLILRSSVSNEGLIFLCGDLALGKFKLLSDKNPGATTSSVIC